MRRSIATLLLAVAIAVFGAANGFAQSEATSGNLRIIEGELHSAASLFADSSTDRAAFAKGLPGGIRDGEKFTMLLVDGFVLGKLLAALPDDANHVRVQGIIHDGARSLTPKAIIYMKSGSWRTFDLPLSGTASGEIYGGEAGLRKAPDDESNVKSAENGDTATIEGTLTEARCYFTTGAVGGKHRYCAFMSMKANLPVGILTDRNEFVYLDIDSKQLAMQATKTIRAEGRVVEGGRVLKPAKLSVKNGDSWEEIR